MGQSAYFCIDFLVLMQYLGVVKAENGCLMSIIKNVDATFFEETVIFRFPYPLFHYSIIASFPRRRDTSNRMVFSG
jgi:hypothetical protein